MPNTFNVEAKRSTFQLPPLTRQQIKALVLDLDLDAREVIIRAVAEFWQHEIGEADRDLAAELDEVKRRLDVAGL